MTDQLLSKTGTGNKNITVEMGQASKKGKSACTEANKNKSSGIGSPRPKVMDKGNIQTVIGPTSK